MVDHTPCPPHAHTTVRAMKILPHDAQTAPFLLVEIAIDCPTCGVIEVQILGHHLRGLTTAFEQILGQHPELCPPTAVRKGDDWQATVAPGKEMLN